MSQCRMSMCACKRAMARAGVEQDHSMVLLDSISKVEPQPRRGRRKLRRSSILKAIWRALICRVTCHPRKSTSIVNKLLRNEIP